MNNLGIVPNGAVLIRNGIIEDVGPARRVENLAGARHAREIDATGRVVMPAFVDADVALATPAPLTGPGGEPRDDGAALRLMSSKRVLARAAATAAECARYGCLSAGAHTRCATDLRSIRKVLRTHQMLQGRPLRIRSIFSPRFDPEDAKTPAGLLDMLTGKWLPSVRTKKLSSVLELTVEDLPGAGAGSEDAAMLRAVAVAAAGLGYAIRLRSASALDAAHLQLALSAGAIAVVAPVAGPAAFSAALSSVGCVRAIPASEAFDDPEKAAPCIRSAMDEGAAIALTTSYRPLGPATLNLQYVLYLAVRELELTPEEAITAVTWNAACSLRLSHAAGSLEPGKPADLLLMEVPDYRELARRAGHSDANLVMRAGQAIVRGAAPAVA